MEIMFTERCSACFPKTARPTMCSAKSASYLVLVTPTQFPNRGKSNIITNNLCVKTSNMANDRPKCLPKFDPQSEDSKEHFSQVMKQNDDKLCTDKYDTWRNPGSRTRAQSKLTRNLGIRKHLKLLGHY